MCNSNVWILKIQIIERISNFAPWIGQISFFGRTANSMIRLCVQTVSSEASLSSRVNKVYFLTLWHVKITLKAPNTPAADDILISILPFERNKSWHFVWIVCPADDSHEMPSLIFSENYKNWNNSMSSATTVCLALKGTINRVIFANTVVSSYLFACLLQMFAWSQVYKCSWIVTFHPIFVLCLLCNRCSVRDVKRFVL